MRVSKEKAAQNRERILTSAARLFREHGIGATGVDAITEDAGLTHGGLYSQFGSKEVIAAEAIRFALARGKRVWQRALERNPGKRALPAIVDGYLSRAHRDAPGTGCVVAALGTDIARQPRRVRQAFTREIKDDLEFLSRLMPRRRRFTPLRGCDRRVRFHGRRADSRACGQRRATFRFDIEEHGEASDQACQAASGRPPLLDARRYVLWNTEMPRRR